MDYSKDQVNLLAQAAEAVAEINLEIAELQEKKDALLAVFKNEDNGMVPRTEPYVFGRAEVKVTKNERLDDGLAKRELGAMVYKKVAKTVLDTAAARKVLSQEELAKITKKYDNKIEVRIK